jgi:molybdopterin-guanine dinucleotide biosynthesis protein A
MVMNFSAVLLAGGASRRMGRDKATLYWKGASLLVHQAGILRQTGAQQLLVSGRTEQISLEGFTLVTDIEAGAGPAAALADTWRETNSPVLIALAIDSPRIPAEYLRELALAALQQERSIIPMLAGRYEPLAAAWHRSCVSEFFGSAGRSLQSICGMLAKANLITVREVSDGEAQLFDNINTPDDYERLGGWR